MEKRLAREIYGWRMKRRKERLRSEIGALDYQTRLWQELLIGRSPRLVPTSINHHNLGCTVSVQKKKMDRYWKHANSNFLLMMPTILDLVWKTPSRIYSHYSQFNIWSQSCISDLMKWSWTDWNLVCDDFTEIVPNLSIFIKRKKAAATCIMGKQMLWTSSQKNSLLI